MNATPPIQWNRLILFALMGALIVVSVVAFRALSLNNADGEPQGTPSQPEPTATEVVQGYPGPEVALLQTKPTQSPEGYPGPQPTSDPSLPIAPTPAKIDVHPLQSPTPWLTFTPLPISTRKPGPTQTPLPLLQPATDNRGVIRYIVYTKVDNDKGHHRGALRSLAVDKAGGAQTGIPPIEYPISGSWRWLYPSPDGERVAVAQNIEAGDKVTIVYPKTGKSEPLFKDQAGLGAFFGWHPDGRHVLYNVESNFTGPNNGLWLVNVETGEVALIANQQIGAIYAAEVSPTGQQVVYHHSSLTDELWVIDIDGSNPHIIYTKHGSIGSGHWSPNAREIAFVAEGGLMVLEANGDNPRQLADSLQGCASLTWSPDSQRIACVALAGPRQAIGKGSPVAKDPLADATIYIVEVATGDTRPLLLDSSVGNIDPVWSPDGSQIAFVSIRNSQSQIWIVNTDGTDLRPLTNGDQLARFPVWQRATD